MSFKILIAQHPQELGLKESSVMSFAYWILITRVVSILASGEKTDTAEKQK